ncbi:MAG: OmpP1/FadL family transporter [Gemmatimonadota bacterium]
MIRALGILALAAVATTGAARPAVAQAWLRWEQNARVLALGGAGAGLADDASAVFFHPAGITHLFGSQAQIGGALAAGSARFNAFGAADAEQEDRAEFDGALYLTHAVAARVTAGLAVNSPWGLEASWENPDAFVGRFRATESRLGSVLFNPVLAWQLDPAWSVAAGIDVLHATFDLARLEQDPAISAFGGGGPLALARARLNLDGTGIGWNAAVAYHPSSTLAAGLQYRDEIAVNFNGVAAFTIVAPADLRPFPRPGHDQTIGAFLDATFVPQTTRTALVFPRQAALGATWAPFDRWRVAAELQWVQWSAADGLLLAFADTTLADTMAFDFHDVWTLRAGVEYRLRPDLLARLGVARRPSPAPARAVTPLLPDADRLSLSTGIGYTWNLIDIDLGYRLTLLDDRQGAAFPGPPAADGVYASLEHDLALSISRPFE